MSDALRSSPVDNHTALEDICQKIQGLYPGCQEIQFFATSGHVSFWAFHASRPFAPEVWVDMQQRILTDFSQLGLGLRCSTYNIHQISYEDILVQSPAGKHYMREVQSQIAPLFPRENIQISYSNTSGLVVYGAAPRDHGCIQEELLRFMPHRMPCPVRFRPSVEHDEVAQAVARANRTFSGVDIPGETCVSGISLLFGQLGRIFGDKYFPR